MTLTADSIKTLQLNQIAALIESDWAVVSPYAAPYLNALYGVKDITDTYFSDNAASIVSYFLSNASQWKGETAKLVKAELKRRTAAYYKAN